MLYAALVRGTHVFSAGFPLGDGGMFYAMARDLQASAYALPDQIASLTGAGALSGAFWGTLIGLIFMVPVLGLAVGAISGALSGKAMDLGVDDRFIKDVGDAMVPGTSALFLLVVQATPDKVIAEMKEFGGNIVQTNLTQAREDALREASPPRSPAGRSACGLRARTQYAPRRIEGRVASVLRRPVCEHPGRR